MVMTPSQMPPLGMEAPNFSLPDPSGKLHSLHDYGDAKGIVVIFMCNHCPFVKHIRHDLATFARHYQERNIAVIGINSNDAEQYPDDSIEQMAEEIEDIGYTFPYLYDESQEVAKAYRAACTPDFYLFDGSRRLVYRGQFDEARPGNGVPVTGADLRAAVDALLEGRPIDQPQKPSIGCNIKWRRNNAPEWFG